ncbi:hypothetical protein [Spiroplasma endosymbiont of Nebria brevicollis]|uniref:hypothetical protein n=1 Tax=Spiroplasma endosymbiont of Nebria brevicollis TaxID=3066284 RepID=UPI00313D20E6
MRKIISFFSIISLLGTSVTTTVACEDNTFLTIDEGHVLSLFNNTLERISFRFMYYTLPPDKQSKSNINSFSSLQWKQSSDLKSIYCKLVGYVKATPISYAGSEYWELEIKDTNAKGLFVYSWNMHTHNPWK